MEQKFKKILQKAKGWDEGTEPLAKTFEGALFQGTNWPFSFEESAIETQNMVAAPAAPQVVSKPAQKVLEGFDKLVLFVGDTFNAASGAEDLLGKMITAMKLKPQEFERFSFNEALEDINDLEQNLKSPDSATSELFATITKIKPQIVVSLGATVTNVLLGRREKLSGIHGQFIEKTIDSHHFAMMPLFHPDFLLINPNMKRTAWIDLQKVMERVGKI